jgi:hypothetical protein
MTRTPLSPRKSSHGKEIRVAVQRPRVAVKLVRVVLLMGVLLVTAKVEAGILDASWTAPTTNTDGSPLTDLGSYRIYYSTSASPCPGSSFVEVASPTSIPQPGQTMSAQLTGLTANARYFVSVTAFDTMRNQSDCSTTASAVARDDSTGNISSPSTAQPAAPQSAGLSAAPASVPRGGSITATWSGIAAPTSTDWIGLYAEGSAGGAYLAWVFASCSHVPAAPMASGSCTFQIPPSQTPGSYEFRLYAANQFTRLATSNLVTVTSSSGSPTLTTASASGSSGGRVVVTWSGIATPKPTDWIGLYAAGSTSGAYLAWIYVDCSQWSGNSGEASGSCSFAIPQGQPPGRYEFRLYAANQFQRLATSAPFMVTQ